MTWRPDDEASLGGWWFGPDPSPGTVAPWSSHEGNGPALAVAGGAMGGPEAGSTNTPNGRQAVQFVNASQEALSAALVGIEGPFTFAMFASVSGFVDNQFFAGWRDSNVDFAQARVDRWRGRIDGGPVADAVVTTTAAWQTFYISAVSNVVTFTVGGVTGTGSSTSAVFDRLTLGSFRSSGQTDPTAHWADMVVAEAVAFDASIPYATLDAYFTRQWLAERFTVEGVTLNLSAADPTQTFGLRGTLVHDGPFTRWRAAFDEPRRGGP